MKPDRFFWKENLAEKMRSAEKWQKLRREGLITLAWIATYFPTYVALKFITYPVTEELLKDQWQPFINYVIPISIGLVAANRVAEAVHNHLYAPPPDQQ